MKSTIATANAIVIDENTVLMPPGKYRLGDPCYSVPNERWMEWLQAAEYETEENLFATLDGWPVLGFHTAYGDGAFVGSDDFTYPVDAGLIGLVPVEIAGGEDRDDLWTVVEFTRPTLCSNSAPNPEAKGFSGRTHGLMRFGNVTIDTRD